MSGLAGGGAVGCFVQEILYLRGVGVASVLSDSKTDGSKDYWEASLLKSTRALAKG